MMLVLVLIGPLVGVWLYAVVVLVMAQRQSFSEVGRQRPHEPTVVGYVANLGDLDAPRDGKVAARAAGQWADSEEWAILAVPLEREPGVWYPPLGPPDEAFSPLPVDPTDPTSMSELLVSGEPYVE